MPPSLMATRKEDNQRQPAKLLQKTTEVEAGQDGSKTARLEC
jgi:hypothetical protein